MHCIVEAPASCLSTPINTLGNTVVLAECIGGHLNLMLQPVCLSRKIQLAGAFSRLSKGSGDTFIKNCNSLVL